MEHLTLVGQLTCARLLDILQLNDPEACRQRLTWLIDLSNAHLVADPDEVRELGNHLLAYRRSTACAEDPCRAALVVKDDFTYGLLRMLQVYAEQFNVEMHVVRNRQDALEWLGRTALTCRSRCSSPAGS